MEKCTGPPKRGPRRPVEKHSRCLIQTLGFTNVALPRICASTFSHSTFPELSQFFCHFGLFFSLWHCHGLSRVDANLTWCSHQQKESGCITCTLLFCLFLLYSLSPHLSSSISLSLSPPHPLYHMFLTRGPWRGSMGSMDVTKVKY